jgi:uncharacterized protein YlxP (DUF503 family)
MITVRGREAGADGRWRTSGSEGAERVFVGSIELDLLLGDVRSLKQKRSLVRPLVAELRRKYDVSAAEAGHLDLHRRALVGVAVVAADRAHCVDVLDACERLVAYRPEMELLATRRQLLSSTDETGTDQTGGDETDRTRTETKDE